MKLIILLSLLCVAATVPPIPKVKYHHKPYSVTQGDGAKALLQPMPPPLVPHTNVFYWVFPPGINPSNYWWNIESSSDLRTWQLAVSNASGNVNVNVNTTDKVRVFRLTGRLTP